MGHVPHVYLPRPWEDERLELGDEQTHHLARVLRVRDGEPVSYTDGSGVVGSGRLSGGGLRRGGEQEIPRPNGLTVAVAPPSSRSRTRFVVEKLAELGVVSLMWIQTRHSEGRPPSPGRSHSWSVSALEQSRGAWLMDLSEVKLADLDPHRLVVAAVGSPTSGTVPSDPILMVGPEGGLDEGEIPAGASRISLGPTVLRVETAALVGAALLSGIASS